MNFKGNIKGLIVWEWNDGCPSFHVLDSIWFLSEFDSYSTCILNNEFVMIILNETTIFIKD